MSDWFEQGGSGSPVKVKELLEYGDTWAIIAGCISAGALVSLGNTSDGGALGLTVTVDGQWRREYFRTGEEMEAWLQGGEEAILIACKDRSASSGPRKRSRTRER